MRIVSEGVNTVAARPQTGVLVITHYQRILNYIKPQFVHVLFGGRIVENGGPELVEQLEEKGYDWVRDKYPEAARTRRRQKRQPAAAATLMTDDERKQRCTGGRKEYVPAMDRSEQPEQFGIKDDYKYGFRDSDEDYSSRATRG